MNPMGDHICDRLTSPLRCHMSDTLHGDELDAIVLLDETRDLSVSVPGTPGLGDFTVELGQPLLATVGRNGTISITRVEHHGNARVLKDVVDPKRCLVLQVVLQVLRAHLPGGHRLRYVQRCSCRVLVHVVGDVVAEDRFVALCGRQPRCVLRSGVTTSVGLFFAVDHGGSIARFTL